MLAKNWSKTKDSGHKFILQISPSDPLRGIMTKPSNIAILLKIIKDNQNIDNISIIKNNKGYFK